MEFSLPGLFYLILQYSSTVKIMQVLGTKATSYEDFQYEDF